MMKKLLFLTLLLALATGFYFIQGYWANSIVKTPGYLQVTSVPAATLFIDGKAISQTPRTQTLQPGKYKIKLIPATSDPLQQKTLSYESEVTIMANQYTVVRRNLDVLGVTSSGEVMTLSKMTTNILGDNGGISVETSPPGAIVSLDGQDVAVSPSTMNNLSPGVHEVSVFIPKFKRMTTSVNVESGYVTHIKYDLGLDPDYQKKFDVTGVFEASLSAKLGDKQVDSPEVTPTPTGRPAEVFTRVEILQTPTGFLRVRESASLSALEIAKVKPGEKYTYKSESNGWVQIEISADTLGWVSEDYVKKIK